MQVFPAVRYIGQNSTSASQVKGPFDRLNAHAGWHALVHRPSEEMAKHGVAELWLKPSALRRHDSARISDGHQFLNTRRKH